MAHFNPIELFWAIEYRQIQSHRPPIWNAIVTRVVKNDRPAAVLFNVSNLQYEFGDAIGGIATPLIVKRKSAIPACFIANGATAKALQWFFQEKMIFNLFGFRLFSDRERGIAFLKERIGAT